MNWAMSVQWIAQGEAKILEEREPAYKQNIDI